MARAGLKTGLLLVAAMLIAACSNTGASNPPATAANPTSAPASNPPATQAAAPIKLELRADAALGSVVTGAGGMSLYVFLKDKGDGASACYGNCAGSWPPLTVPSASGVVGGSGVTGELGTISRTDGTLQVTLGGAPLYYFAGDAAAGDTKGQGLNDVWYLTAPSGAAADGTSAGATPASSKCGGPTCY